MIVFLVLKNDVSRVEQSRFKVRISFLFCCKFDDVVLDPIPTADLSASDVDRIVVETRDKMLNVLEKISSTTNPIAANGTAGLKKEL
jgi:hypothetical protein